MLPLSIAPRAAGAAKATKGSGLPARAPLLKAKSDLIIASVVKGLQTMAGPTTMIEGRLVGMTMSRARDVVAGVSPDLVVASIVAKEPPCVILASLDGTLVHAIVELLCGGNGAEAPAAEPRAATPIDQQFAQIIFTLVASAAQTECADLGFKSLRAAKIEGPLTADVFGARIDEVAVVDTTISIFGLHGTLRLALPPVALDRFSGEATKDAEIATTDALWSSHLQRELGLASVTLSAYLDAKDISLGALAGLKIGQILPLPPEARSRASLISDGAVLYRGEVGRDDTHYSLRIEELVSEPAQAARMATRRSSYFEVSKA